MADHETNQDQDHRTSPNLYTIPAEPLGAGAHPTVSLGCNKERPQVKKHPVSPAEVVEAIGTRL
jgi:hypothetical protein